jgi:N utilization substance protein B
MSGPASGGAGAPGGRPPAVERGSARRRSRRAALQALYSADLRERATGAPDTPLAALDALAEHFELAPGARAFAEDLVKGVAAERATLDARLARVARNWRLERMALVDRNVLRLAAWEMIFGGTPAAVAIDEAVELAREFGDESSSRFVNGVLDALRKEEERA